MSLPGHRDVTVLTVLLDQLADTLPGPTVPRSSREASSGFGKTTWLACPKCLGERTIRWKKVIVECDHPNCRGAGGWWIDSHDDSEQPIAEQITDDLRADTLIRCDRCDSRGVHIRNHHLERCDSCHGEGYRRPNWVWRTPLDDEFNIALDPTMSPALDMIVIAITTMRVDVPELCGPMLIAYVHRLTPVGMMILPMRHAALRGLLVLRHTLPSDFRAPRTARVRAAELIDLETERRIRAARPEPDHEHRRAEARRLALQGRSLRYIAKKLGTSKSTIERDLAA